MENKTNLETLEEGFVESKPENPCNNILEEVGSDFLCNLSGKCTANVYSGHSEVNHDVELGRKISYGGIEESYVIAGNNRISKGAVDCNLDDKLLMNGNNIENNDVLDLEGDLNFGWYDEKSDDVLKEPMEEDTDVLHSHEPGSPTKIEVSGSGINLFVEVFGPLDGIRDGNNNVSDKVEGLLQESDLGQENETLYCGGENVNAKSEGEDIVGEEQCTFDVGDLVWAKTRSPLWWPGMISDPSKVAKDETKSEKRGSFLVKYFGNSNFVWCLNSEMKPFLEFFESMSKQNNSRSFLGSVEKALCEFGQHVKSKMTCPCFSKESGKKENSMSVVKTSIFDVLSFSQFEAVDFSACIKNLARSVFVPDKIELTIVKNRLSAFYCSLGHLELPLQSLRSSGDDGDDKITSSGKSFESRERKKSKYLSFPYIDAVVGQETEDVKHISSQSTKSTAQSSGKKNSRKKGPEKPLKGRHIISKADDIDGCSTELLNELCSTARDCFYLGKSKYSDSLRTFYYSFRIFAFLDADTACKVAVAHQAPKREKRLAQISTEPNEKMEGDAGQNSASEGIGGAKESVNIESSKTDTLQEKGNVVRKKAKKKKEQVVSAGSESVSNSSITGLNITTDDSGMISFQQTGSDVHKSVKAPKKRKVGPTPGLPHIETIAKVSDMNGNQPSISFQHMPVGGSSTNINGIDQIVFGSVSSIKDVQVALQNMKNREGVNGTNQFPNAESTTRGLESNVINNRFGPFIQKSFQMGTFPSSGKLESKKRKRKESPCQVDTVIPDLNGNVLENLPEGNYILSPVGKPELKSMRNKSANTETGSNVKINRVFNKVEDPGGSLLLNFAPESTLPSKETLVKTFSRFGLLKESKIQVSDDLTVQIVYERSSDARFAFRSLEKSKPFGESLVGFKLHCMPAVTASRPKEKRKKLQTSRPIGPVNATKNLARPAETPDIALMRQNVEMMKMTLEKAGNNLSAEMRAVLENEIKGFLDKISATAGSSSS
ncbi:hypothetical protein BUALT_Bualt07G0032500 [Buddleja alternifolia]|uniref:PWWP domain-containing protein n=1 Tax=Buddleja alternifolia TaxID=168488 RepID=A0AAV6X7K2_9LAMI|nr:hypothetical protein BUALT_Bualt07G0032500 [Buddleja alternifolia]